jgi:hypothetical protein
MTTTGSLLAVFIAAGLMRSGWPTYPVGEAPAELRPAIQRGDLVIVTLQSEVLRELRAEMAAGGPEHAVKSCHVDAAGVALRIARREGVEAGRTSARLRSPRNAPRAWAADIVARHAGKSARAPQGFVVDLGDRVGLLRPITEQPICGGCHGPAGRIQPAVRADITARYPSDRATGFEDGDLRGWFWVELPKERRTR